MRTRRRRLRGLHLAQELHRPGRGLAHLPGARDGRRGQHRPDARVASRGRSTRRAPNTTITAQPSDPTQRDRRRLLLQLHRGRLDVRVPARRRRLRGLRLAQELHRPAPTARTPSRCAPPTPPATPTRRPRRYTWTIDTAAPNTTITAQPQRPEQLRGRRLLLQLDRGRLDLRVPDRRRRLVRLRQPEELHRPEPTARTPSRCAPPTPRATPTRPRRASPGRSTPLRRTPRSPRSRTTRRTRPARRSPSARREGGSTFECQRRQRRLGAVQLAEDLHRASPTARTPSRCARPTPPATPTRPRRPTPGRSTPPRRTRRSPRSRATRATRPPPTSPSARPRAARRSSAGIDGGSFAACASPKSYTGLRRRLPHLPGARHRRGRQHRPDARRASPGRSTPPRRTPRSPRSPATRATPPTPTSPSAPARAARPSSAGSTAAPGPPAPRRRATPASATARTPSRSARPTPQATPTPTPASFTWTIDTTAPNTTITAQPNDPIERHRAELHLQLVRGRLDVRVPARRRRASPSCSLAQELHRPRRRLAHLPGARDRRRRQHRRDPRELHLDDRHRRAELVHELPGEHRLVQHRRLERRLLAERHLRHCLRHRLGPRPRRGVDPAQHRQPLLERLVLRERARGLAERRRRLVEPRLRRRRVPGRRQLHDPRPRTRPRRQPRGAREPHLHDRHHAAQHLDRLRSREPDERPGSELRLLRRARRRQLRVPPRRRLVERLRVAEGLHGARGGLAHLRGARAGRRRERRPDACDADLDDRPDGTELGDRLPGERRLLQRRRLEQPVRHRLRRRRPRPRRGLAPARGRLALLERNRLRRRLRELAHRNRNRYLVARVRGDELPGRRRLLDPRARGRRRRQRRGALVPHVHRRHGSAGDDDRHLAGQSGLERERVLHLLGRPAGLHLRVPHRRRRVDCVHEPAELHLARRGLPHLRGPGNGRRRKRRPVPRLAHVGRRHGSARRDDGRPRPVPQGDGQSELHVDRHRRQRRGLRRLRALARRCRHLDSHRGGLGHDRRPQRPLRPPRDRDRLRR